LLFQAVDDALDVTGDRAVLGKTPGKDAALERGTLVAVLGLDGARREAERLATEARRAAAALGPGPRALAEAAVEFVLVRRS
jgi:farnesyl diphosphate synthase